MDPAIDGKGDYRGLRELIEMRNKRSSGQKTYWSSMKELIGEENSGVNPFSASSNSNCSPQDDSRISNVKIEKNDEIPSNESSDGNITSPTQKLEAPGEGSPYEGSYEQDDLEDENPQLGEGEPDVELSGSIEKKVGLDEGEQFRPSEDQSDAELGDEMEVSENAASLEQSDNNAHEISDDISETSDKNTLSKADDQNDPNIWTLPLDRDQCTLEEIRRGQVINRVANNECPVLGCGKLINELRAEPSPGTISAGLRTHVLFVHYGNRKASKKRKLGWSTKRRSQSSPKKAAGVQSPSLRAVASTSRSDYDANAQNSSVTNLTKTGLSLMSRGSITDQMSRKGASTTWSNKKMKQTTSANKLSQPFPMSSLQSLIQATGGAQLSPQQQTQTQSKNDDLQKNFNQTTSSLFSILAGLTQQPQQPNSVPRVTNVKTAQGTNTINISQCSRNSNPNRPLNSSLLSLLNEQISGNVANSLQTQLKKSLNAEQRNNKSSISNQRQNISPPVNPYYPSHNSNNIINNHNSTEPNFVHNSSILNSLCSAGLDNRSSLDNSTSLNSFIDTIAVRTGSNIGTPGIIEAKKMIEKFTTSLICSAQTIADHYIAPFSGEPPQQKPEISPSDILLAYKMMQKSAP